MKCLLVKRLLEDISLLLRLFLISLQLKFLYLSALEHNLSGLHTPNFCKQVNRYRVVGVVRIKNTITRMRKAEREGERGKNRK